MKKLLRPDEIAALLDISVRQTYRLISAGHFTVIRIDGPGSALRVTSESFDDYLLRRAALFELENGLREAP